MSGFYPLGIGADPVVSQYLLGYAPRGEPCKELEPRLAATPHSFYDLSILAVSPLLRDKEEMYIRILLEEGTRDSSRNSLCINRIYNVLVPFPYLIDRPSTLQVDTPLHGITSL